MPFKLFYNKYFVPFFFAALSVMMLLALLKWKPGWSDAGCFHSSLPL